MYVCIYLKIDVYIYIYDVCICKQELWKYVHIYTHIYIYISLYILSSSIESSSSLMRADEFNGIDITVLVWT